MFVHPCLAYYHELYRSMFRVTLLVFCLLCLLTPPGVRAEPPSRDPVPTLAAAAPMIGIVVARNAVDLTFEINGCLAAVLVELGDPVSEGAILARLDAWSVHHDLEMARADLVSSRAEVEMAFLEHDQTKLIYKGHAAYPDSWSAEELAADRLAMNLAAAARAVAEARVSRQQAAVDRLIDMLAATEMEAPFSGTIAGRYRDPGALVGPGIPILRLISTGELLVRFAVPEMAVGLLKPGLPVMVSFQFLDEIATGNINHISPEIDPASHTLTVEASLMFTADASSRIRSGMTALVTFADAGHQ